MDNEPEGPTGSISSQWSFLIFLGIIGVLLLAVFLTPLSDYFSEAGLIKLLDSMRDIWWSPILVIIVIVIATPIGIPTTPLMIGGAAYGVWMGSIYNNLGLIVGAALSYELARLLGRDFVVAVTGDKIRGIEKRFQRVAFWPLVQLCFTPLPFPIINYGAALSGIPRKLFLSAITVGLIPSTVLHTYFIVALIDADWDRRGILLAAYISVFLIFNIITGYPWISERIKRKANYKRLMAIRSQRNIRSMVSFDEKD